MTGLFSLIRYARKIIREKQQDFDQRNHELLDAVRTYALTRIPNRVGFTEMLADFQVDRLSLKTRKPFALCFMDLDRFKEVNDKFGHQVGDGLLIQVTQRLLTTLRTSDVIARLAGNEFVLLIDDFGGRNQLKKILNRIISDINVPFVIHDYLVRVSISIGVTISPPDKGSGELLIQHADIAMYAAKKQGRNQWVIFDEKGPA